MVVLGFIVLALAVASVCVLIGANTGEVDVSALGGTWTVQLYWLVIAGVVLTAAAILGILLIVIGGARTRKQRAHRRELERENRRLSSQVGAAPSGSGDAPHRAMDGDTHHVQPAPMAPVPPANPGGPGAPGADTAFPPPPART